MESQNPWWPAAVEAPVSTPPPVGAPPVGAPAGPPTQPEPIPPWDETAPRSGTRRSKPRSRIGAVLAAIVAFLAGAALFATFWALPYVYRTRRQAQKHEAQLTEALATVRRLEEEHNRAEYLSFLNNVSKAAITSKKPVELLNQVVEEVQRTFQFDHISIGVVDYARKEIEVRAESGRDEYRLGLGKRVPLEAGVLGIAAQRNELRAGGLLLLLLFDLALPQDRLDPRDFLAGLAELAGIFQLFRHRLAAQVEQVLLLLDDLALEVLAALVPDFLEFRFHVFSAFCCYLGDRVLADHERVFG